MLYKALVRLAADEAEQPRRRSLVLLRSLISAKLVPTDARLVSAALWIASQVGAAAHVDSLRASCLRHVPEAVLRWALAGCDGAAKGAALDAMEPWLRCLVNDATLVHPSTLGLVRHYVKVTIANSVSPPLFRALLNETTNADIRLAIYEVAPKLRRLRDPRVL